MVDIRELNLNLESDFEIMGTHIAHLYVELFGPSSVPDAATMADLRRQYVEHEPAHWAFVGANAAGEVVVFATLAESFAVFARGRYGIINELWVRSGERSAGLGAEMLEHIEAIGRQRGWHRIDVSAPQDPRWDRSHAFYVKRGFQPTGRKLKRLLA